LYITSSVGAVNTFTVNSGGIFTVSENFSVKKSNLVLGSANQPAVTGTITLKAVGVLGDASVTNYGTLTVAGAGELLNGTFSGPNTFTNGAGGTLTISNPKWSFTGTFRNEGNLKFNAAISVTPEFTNLGTVQVYTGTVDFKTKAIQTGGEFQLRDDTVTVKVSGGTQTLAIADGALTGKGTIDANLTMGSRPNSAARTVSPRSGPVLSIRTTPP
jgi:hypothetical protein